MLFTFPVHSVIVTFGPIHSGKSTFIQRQLVPGLKKSFREAAAAVSVIRNGNETAVGAGIASTNSNTHTNGNAEILMEPIIQVLSSDALRRTFLYGNTADVDAGTGIANSSNRNAEQKLRDQSMLEMTGLAFSSLKQQLALLLTYPSRPHFVILDTTGLHPNFHKDIQTIVNQHQYSMQALGFRFSIQEHLSVTGTGPTPILLTGITSTASQVVQRRKQVAHHVQQMNKLMPELCKYYDRVQILRRRVIEGGEAIQICVDSKQVNLLSNCTLNPGFRYFVVPDVRECYDDLKNLLAKAGFEIDANDQLTPPSNNTRVVLLGNLIDSVKSPARYKLIDFVYRNRAWIHIVAGNHEHALHKSYFPELTLMNLSYNNGRDEKEDSQFAIDFANQSWIRDSGGADEREAFRLLYQEMTPFLYYQSRDEDSRSFLTTHAPCESKFLGKLDSASIIRQSFWPLPDENRPLDQQLRSISQADDRHLPRHLVGQVSLLHPCIDHSVWALLDTACVGGNMLTGAWAGKGLSSLRLVSIPASSKLQERITPLTTLSMAPPRNRRSDESAAQLEASFSALPVCEQKRCKQMIAGKVNFISGTICPANKTDTELESIAQALDYYRERGVSTILLEPKWMGSRLQYYYFPGFPDRCYGVSRSGIVQKGKPYMNAIYQQVQARLQAFHIPCDLFIIDGELMPWSLLGRGLIEEHFEPALEGARHETRMLAELGFNTRLAEYDQLVLHSPPTSDAAKSTERRRRELRATDLQVTFDEEHKALDVFEEQLSLFAADSEPVFKMFHLLKYVRSDDGQECIPALMGVAESLHLQWLGSQLEEDAPCLVELDAPDADNRVMAYWQKITSHHKMEGVVIKLEFAALADLKVAPFLKVRNSQYLSLIYGHNYLFPAKQKKLIKEKSIGKKLKTSIREHALGMAMLQVPYNSLTAENPDYVQSILAFAQHESLPEHSSIDPRL